MNEIFINNNRFPKAFAADYLVASESFVHADRTVDFDILIYVTEGCIEVVEDQTEYEIQKGDLLFLKRNIHHYGIKENQPGTAWYYIHFDDGHMNEEESDALKLPKFIHNLEGSEIEQAIHDFITSFHETDQQSLWYRNNHLFQVLSQIAFWNHRKILPLVTLSDKIEEYLASMIGEPFSAKVLEKEFYLSYKYLATVFKKEKKLTMQSFHRQKQMEEATKLLKTTRMQIGEIANALGYSDALYFSRCFHTYYGKSPSQFRRDIPYFY